MVTSRVSASVAAVVLIFLMTPSTLATPSSKTNEIPQPASTTVSGVAFGEKFTAGYAYARADQEEGTVFVVFGNGKTGGCEVKNSSETAFIGMNHPAKIGTYTTVPAEAHFSTSSLEPRAFQSFKIEVKSVSGRNVQGSVQLVSDKGTVTGEFNAVICP